MPVSLPAVKTVRETVYLDRINTIRLLIETYDPDTDTFTGVDFSAIASWSVELVSVADPDVLAGPWSSATYPEIADGDASGNVTLQLGERTIDPGDWWLRLAAIDVANDATQVIHESGPLYRVLLTVAESEG